jgi:hypothetical protein
MLKPGFAFGYLRFAPVVTPEAWWIEATGNSRGDGSCGNVEHIDVSNVSL